MPDFDVHVPTKDQVTPALHEANPAAAVAECPSTPSKPPTHPSERGEATVVAHADQVSSQPFLLSQHKALLEASGISAEVAAARGYYSERVKLRLGKLGFGHTQWHTPCLVLPVWGVDGVPELHQIRPDKPRDRDGKPVKYETPAGARMRLDVHPAIRPRIGDSGVPLFITEGIRKADAAISRGLCCIALLGVWNWRGKNEAGGTTALGDWERVALKDRTVYLVFDSDAASNDHVRGALHRLKLFLECRGARVKALELPAKPDGGKNGLDDYLAAGNASNDLLSLPELSFAERAPTPGAVAGQYRATQHGLVRERATKDGIIEVPLTNFDAKIIADVVVTDGEEEHREFDIEATVAGKTVRVSMPAESFDGMGWVTTRLGAQAVVHAGHGTRDHVRAAIQFLSGEVRRVTAYSHLGWAQHEGRWVFRHAGGAIGADPGADPGAEMGTRSSPNNCDFNALEANGPTGPIPDDDPRSGIGEARLPASLANFRLPAPPQSAALVAAVRASLRMLDVGPDHVTLPLYAAIWRAPLGATEYSLYLVARTGEGKSTLAALAQQHFGAQMDGEHLPASWSSTANANEALAHLAKDVLLVVDDWVPRGTEAEVQRANKEADRLLRAQGNHSGRSRCDRSGTPKEGKRPRGFLVSTGEETPEGESLNARILTIEVKPGDVMKDDKAVLTECQEDARAGLYAQAMAGYLRWLAPRYASVDAERRAQMEELRQVYRTTCRHARTATIVADLIAGFEFFCEFAEQCGALTREEHEALWHRLEASLLRLAADQNRKLATHDPVEQFIVTLRGALLSGRAHLSDRSGRVPDASPAAWGWEERTRQVLKAKPEDGAAESDNVNAWDGEGEYEEITDWYHRGDRIGWVEGDNLYLEVAPTVALVQRLARDGGQNIPLTARTLGKTLDARGLLKSREENRGKYTTRINALGRRTDALHLAAACVINPEWCQANFLEPGHEFPSDELLS